MGNDVSLNLCQPSMYMDMDKHLSTTWEKICYLFRSPSKNLYVFWNLLGKPSSKFFYVMFLSKQLNVSKSFFIHIFKASLTAFAINFAQTFCKMISQTWQRTGHKYYTIDESYFMDYTLLLFSIGTEKIMHFSVFSARNSYCPLNSSVSFLVMKWQS